MANLAENIREAVASIASMLRSGKDAYEGASRFARMRLWAIAVFGADVLLVVLFVALSGGRPLDLEVWFQPGFPSNMVVFRNEGREALKDVELVLDGRFRLKVNKLPTGLRGFELNRDFRDATNAAPPDGYRPRVVEVRTPDDAAEIEVEARATP